MNEKSQLISSSIQDDLTGIETTEIYTKESEKNHFSPLSFLYSCYVLAILFAVGLVRIFHLNFIFVASKGVLKDTKVLKKRLKKRFLTLNLD
jgi:hypothetical protein